MEKIFRTLRHQRGWSQEDIANRLGISIPAFSKIETGVTDINLSRLEQIANIYDVNVVNLLALDAVPNLNLRYHTLILPKRKLLTAKQKLQTFSVK